MIETASFCSSISWHGLYYIYHVIICYHMLSRFPNKKIHQAVYLVIAKCTRSYQVILLQRTHPGRGHGLPHRVDDSVVTGASSFTDAAGWDDRVGDTMFDACVYMYVPRHVIQIFLVCNSSVSNAML